VKLGRALLILGSCGLLSLSPLAAVAAEGSFRTGFSQGWIDNGSTPSHGYSVGFSDAAFDEAETRRLLRLTKEAGGDVFRLWLFEGSALNQIKMDSAGRPIGIQEYVLKNYRRTLEIAKEEGVQIYLTLFDANINHFDGKNKAMRDRYWNILNDKYGHGTAFRENVLAPVLKATPEGSALFGVDLVNEANVFVGGYRKVDPLFEGGWSGANRFAKSWGDFVRKSGNRATMSLGWHDAPKNLLRGKLDLNNLDFIDLHHYSDDGKIPNCAALASMARAKGKPIYLGEFGHARESIDEPLQARVTQAYLDQAKACGFEGAFAWRLSEIKGGASKDERFAFESKGVKRSAYKVLQGFNTSLGNLPQLSAEPLVEDLENHEAAD
jgi:hypothetical protein